MAYTTFGMKAKNAWLVRWDVSADERDHVVASQILTFLDGQLSEDSVEKVLKALWVSHSRLMWREKLGFAVRPKQMASSFVLRRDGRIFVGSRPRLNALLVSDVEATDEDAGGRVTWTEFRDGKRKRFEQRSLPHPA